MKKIALAAFWILNPIFILGALSFTMVYGPHTLIQAIPSAVTLVLALFSKPYLSLVIIVNMPLLAFGIYYVQQTLDDLMASGNLMVFGFIYSALLLTPLINICVIYLKKHGLINTNGNEGE